MNQFVNAVENGITETTNGMPAFRGTESKVLDFFYKAPGYRKNQTEVKALFLKAMEEEPDLTIRVAKWLRDIRGGSGERESFRTILKCVAEHDMGTLAKLVVSIPRLGRWDDLWTLIDDKPIDWDSSEPTANKLVMAMVFEGIDQNDGLMFKWMPRKGKVRSFLEKNLGLSPKQYRNMVVAGTKVVETQMCNNEWDKINFSHVPSVAASRYRKAFAKHTPKYAEYLAELKKAVETGDFTKVHVNAGAIFPHDVIPVNWVDGVSPEEKSHAMSQWAMLPNYVGSMSILPIIDTSASMTWVKITNGRDPLSIACALGLYLAEKNSGVFKDVVCAFSSTSELRKLSGNLFDKLGQIANMPVGGSTNLEGAMANILKVAVDNHVPQEDMPKGIIILSDMQFDYAVGNPSLSAMNMIKARYKAAGYEPPTVIFWNLHSHENVPVKMHESGAALFAGYSTAIMKGLIETDGSEITPYGMMLKTIMAERYN